MLRRGFPLNITPGRSLEDADVIWHRSAHSIIPNGLRPLAVKERAVRRPALEDQRCAGWQRPTRTGDVAPRPPKHQTPGEVRFISSIQLDENDRNCLETRGAYSIKRLGGDWMRLLSQAGQKKYPVSLANDSTKLAMGVRGDSWRALLSRNESP